MAGRWKKRVSLMVLMIVALPAPVKHRVDNSEPPTQCNLCGQTHGAGDKN